jgi:hypothetical protein
MTLLAGTFVVYVLLIGLLERDRYQQAEALIKVLDTTIARLGAVSSIRPLSPPFDFAYLDVDGLDAMYAQLEPSLREKQRTVERGGQIAADAKLGSEAASVGISANRRQVETSQLQAIDPAAQRRASDLIMMLSDQKRLPVYKDSGAWFVARLIVPLQDAADALKNAWRIGSLSLRSEPSLDSTPKDSKRRVAESMAEMEQELANLRGQVVVEGPWRIISIRSGIARLEHDFYPTEPGKPAREPAVSKPEDLEPVVFALNVPERPFLKSEPHDFRVFGSILSSAHSRFEIKALAVFY